MKKFYTLLGQVLIGVAVVFFIVYSFVRVGNQNERLSRDIFGFVVPTPPTWAGLIPYLGYFLEFLFQLFSIHGLVGLTVLAILGVTASVLISKGRG